MAFVPDDAMRRKREIKGAAWDVYETLCAFSNPETGIVEVRYASNARLVEWTGLRLGTVKNAMTELRKLEWIREGDGVLILCVGTFLGPLRKLKRVDKSSPTNDAPSPRSDASPSQPSFLSDAPSLYNDAPSPTNDGTYIGVTSPLTSPTTKPKKNTSAETTPPTTRARDPLGNADTIDAVNLTSTGDRPVESGAGLAERIPGNSKPCSSSVGAARTPTGKGMAKQTPSCEPSPPKPEIPDWIPPDAWAEWEVYRREIRRTLTPSTVRAQIAQLDKFRARGMPPEEVIRQSITHGWRGLFKLEDERNEANGRSEAGAGGNHAGSGRGRTRNERLAALREQSERVRFEASPTC